jgi:hypothetical protein
MGKENSLSNSDDISDNERSHEATTKEHSLAPSREAADVLMLLLLLLSLGKLCISVLQEESLHLSELQYMTL